MFRPRSLVSFIVLALVVAMAAGVFFPWVEAGVFGGADFVNGIDIPVLGWSVLILGGIAIGTVLLASLHGSPWLWLLGNFFVVLLTTVLALTLELLDVADSAIVRWVVKALPEQLQESTPTVAASFGLWAMFVGTLLATAATAVASISASRHRHDSFTEESPFVSPPPPPPTTFGFPPSTPGYREPDAWFNKPI